LISASSRYRLDVFKREITVKNKHKDAKKPTTAAAETITEPKVAPDTTVYAPTGVALDAKRKGLIVEIVATLQALGTATAEQVTAALLASGKYQQVAPQAAALRPLKPVALMLKELVTKGVAKVAEAGVVAA
jgi:hypothetical protein